MRAARIDPADPAAMSGHTVKTATRHYTHPLGRSFAAARTAVGSSARILVAFRPGLALESADAADS
jgi:hypothetical protein